MLGGPVRVDDAVGPQRSASELHRHTDGGPDHSEIEVEAEELQTDDPNEIGNSFHVVAEVEMAAARDDRKRGGSQWIFPPVWRRNGAVVRT